MRNPPVAVAAIALLAVFAVAGCSTVSPARTPKPIPTFSPIIFTGSAAGDKDITVPISAHSATFTVVCSGGSFFSLDGALNPNGAGLGGACDGGTHRYEMSLGTLRTLHLEIELPKGGSFVVDTQFSPDRSVVDSELAGQCSAMVTVGSDVFNAEDGFTRGKLSLPQWQQKVSDAAGILQSLGSDKTNILSAQLTNLHSALAAPGVAPGDFEGNHAADYNAAMSIIQQVCEDSGVAIYVNADYGG
jgi:hypothetical protein